MRIPCIRLALSIVAAIPLLGAAPTPTVYKPRILTGVGIDQKLNAQVPTDLVFTDEHGHQVRLAAYFAKRPGSCWFITGVPCSARWC